MRDSQEARQQAEQCLALREVTEAEEDQAHQGAEEAPAVNQAHQGEDLLNRAAARAAVQRQAQAVRAVVAVTRTRTTATTRIVTAVTKIRKITIAIATKIVIVVIRTIKPLR